MRARRSKRFRYRLCTYGVIGSRFFHRARRGGLRSYCLRTDPWNTFVASSGLSGGRGHTAWSFEVSRPLLGPRRRTVHHTLCRWGKWA
jgi:hypothetical protein